MATFTIQQIGERARARNPEALEAFTDEQIGQRLVDRDPRLKALIAPSTQFPKAKPPLSKGQETFEDIKQTGSKIKETFKKGLKRFDEIDKLEAEGQSKFRSFGQKILSSGTVGTKLIGDLIVGGIKVALPQAAEDKVKTGLETGARALIQETRADKTIRNPFFLQPTIQKLTDFNERLKQKNPALAIELEGLLGTASLAADVVGGVAAKNIIKRGIGDAGTAVRTGARRGVRESIDLTVNIGQKAKKAIKVGVKKLKAKPPTPIEAARQVIQGKTTDLKAGLKALSNLDTSVVKTFQDLNKLISSNIKKLAEQVDIDLAADTAKKLLKDLATTAKSTTGKIVKSNPIETALKQLDELYTKIGDNVKAVNIRELLETAKVTGLTKKEINDLARIYGIEFSSKAFSKLGDPLTSVNAQLFENIRKQLKELARSGLGSTAAKQADEAMSNLFAFQRLIKKNVEAVNQLQQKIKNRGLIEKIGNNFSKYANILTGGSIRGFVAGTLPRGAGFKVLNALDIEELLQKNLKIIQDAIKSGTDKGIIEILKKIK